MNSEELLRARFNEFLGQEKDPEILSKRVGIFLDEEIKKHLINRLETLKAIDEEATKKGINISEIYQSKHPLKMNLLACNSFDLLAIPDEKQFLEIFKFVFDKKKCDPNHGFAIRRDPAAAEHGLNPKNLIFGNSWLANLISNEFISIDDTSPGNSEIVKRVLDIEHIIKNFDFNQKSKVYTQELVELTKEKKTPLILAAMMRKSGIVEKLCKLKEVGCNINLDETDGHGRTALFYSCALGDSKSVKALINASDQKKLNAKKALDFCSAKSEVIKSILESVCIEPNRDEGAFRNNLLDPIGNKAKYDDSYKITLKNKGNIEKFISEIPAELKENSDQISEKSHDEIKRFAELQIKHLTGKSLLNSCLEGQVECRDFLKRTVFEIPESPPGSVHSVEGKTIVPKNTIGRTNSV